MREYVRIYLRCAATVSHTPPVPLKPNLLPERPWQNLNADFIGPIAEKYYLHVVIDQYSKYPEVDIVSSTSFSKLEPCLDRIMVTLHIPEQLTTDNGSPYFSDEMAQYAKWMGFKHHPVTPKDPQSNGFAESFVKLLCKLVHTATAEGKDPKRELYYGILQYRATPHATLGKSPAEVLFGSKMQTKLPQYHPISHTKGWKGMHPHHNNKKLQQKALFDKRHKAQPKPVYVGDKVLLKQEKSTTKSPFEPHPYNVIKVKGSQITAQRQGQVNISRTARPILTILVSFCRILNGLLDQINLFWYCSSPLIGLRRFGFFLNYITLLKYVTLVYTEEIKKIMEDLLI